MSNMVVRTNVYSLNAHRNMKNVGLEQKRAANRLSSGYRINSAADDAAGLAISETMRAQIRGLDQASRNAQDGQAMLLTTEGGLDEIGNMLQRTRELLVQASNDTNTQEQRAMIEQEIRQLGQEIGSMQRRVEFNTNRVLDMGPTMDASVTELIGDALVASDTLRDVMSDIETNRADINTVLELLGGVSGTTSVSSLGGAQIAAVNRAVRGVGVAGGLIPNGEWADMSLGDLNDIISAITGIDSIPGVANMTVSSLKTALNTRSRALDTAARAVQTEVAIVNNLAETEFANIRAFVGDQGDGSSIAYFQVGANSSQGITYDFERVARAVTGSAATVELIGAVMSMPADGTGIGNGVSVTQLIARVQDSLDDINTVRANLGAVQNRMDYTMRSLDISSENLQDSESRVRNADIAREMMRFTMSNVLQQSAISMLSQANQLPNNLMQLLR